MQKQINYPLHKRTINIQIHWRTLIWHLEKKISMQINQNKKYGVNTYLKYRKLNQFKMENIFERFHDI